MSKLCSHPNILNAVYSNPDGKMNIAGKTEDVMYNLLEIAENGPISNFIRVTGPIEEDLVRFMFLQLSDAVQYMHSKEFAHLDLKLENILLDKFFNIKLADLGVAHQLQNGVDECSHRRGTIHYMAPEVADLQKFGKYSAYKADIYSLGVCLYILLVGEFPDRKVLQSTSTSTNEFDMEVECEVQDDKEDHSTKKWGKLSENARNLVLQMVSEEPSVRPSIEDVLRHPWL